MNTKLKHFLRNLKFSINTFGFHVYAKLKYPSATWRRLNRQAIEAFRENTPTLSETQETILSDLRTDGIAMTSLDALFPDKDMLKPLADYRATREDRARQNHKKHFLIDYLPEIPELGPQNPFFKLAIDPSIIDVVNSYLGMHSMMYHFMVRKTTPTAGSEPSHSQHWHRTPQEKRVCRVYIYLNDVDSESGPFSYIPQSIPGKKWGCVFPQTTPRGSYLGDDAVEQNIPENERRQYTGKAGTVIFCDTTGLHRGGFQARKERIMSTFGYGAPTYHENIHYSYSEKLVNDLKEGYPQQSVDVLNKKWLRKLHL